MSKSPCRVRNPPHCCCEKVRAARAARSGTIQQKFRVPACRAASETWRRQCKSSVDRSRS